MVLHSETISSLDNNMGKFSNDIQKSIKDIIQMIKNYSPISDINFVKYKAEKDLKGIKLPQENNSWVPIRNVARIIANIAKQNYEGIISRIYVESMNCGCDYFEGTLKLNIGENAQIYGTYKWKWTEFQGRDLSFNKFTDFPVAKSTFITN